MSQWPLKMILPPFGYDVTCICTGVLGVVIVRTPHSSARMAPRHIQEGMDPVPPTTPNAAPPLSVPPSLSLTLPPGAGGGERGGGGVPPASLDVGAGGPWA